MSEQWINDSELREAAARFFATVRSTRCESIEEVTALIETNRGFRSTGSSVFAYDADIQQQLNVLVQRCLKLLGTQTGHEKDIEELAWKHVAMDVSDDTVVKAFITALHTTSTISFSYVAPNYAVRFSDGIREITVGPVQACLAEDTATKVNKRNENPHWYISSGTHPGTKYQGDKTIFELPAVCWYIDVVASKGNIEEETLWLVNIALSLLRLFYPLSHRQPPFPLIGDCELAPTMRPETHNRGLTLSSDGAAFGGRPPLNHYIVDQKVVQHLDTTSFTNHAKYIFNPPNKSVATRIAQGLGWLARGRQTPHRSERFLFFFTAIEALLSSDDKTAPVVQTIARHAATILVDDPEKRHSLARQINKSMRYALL